MLSMLRTIPPFRADMVGSLLRPAQLKEARAKHEAGQISDADLKEVEDAAIIALIAKEESIGLRGITPWGFPPRVLAFRLPCRPRRRRDVPLRPGHQIQGCRY